MSYYEILLAKKLEDKRDPQVKGLTVTENGTYSESGTVYNVVNVNVPLPENCYQKKSVSGAMASFTDGSNEPLSDLVIDITAVQSGSGNPSPTNVRPISGWGGCNLWVQAVADPTENPNISIPFPSTIYGGTLDILSGLLTVDKAIVDLGTIADTGEAGAKVDDYGLIVFSGVNTIIKKPNSNLDTADIICEKYATHARSGISSGEVCVSTAGNIVVRDTSLVGTALTDIPTIFNGVHLVYELATPQTYQLTPTMVRTLLENNNIYADCGDIDVLSYFTKLN